MKSVSEATALIVDNGLFVSLAERLARDGGFKRVLYYSGWECAFPNLNQCIIGDGFERIEKCYDIWSVKDKIDVAIFPDIGRAGIQLELEKQGISVWGSRNADTLEISREKFHRVLGEVGLTVPKFERVVGLTKLRDYLRDKESVFIKISKYRGSLETTHFRSTALDESTLDCWAVKFGPAKEIIPFLVFEAIDTDLELGGDTYCIDGKWPDTMLQAYEWKDKGLFASVMKREDAPEQLNAVMDAFGPVLAKYRHRNFWSMEVRVKDDEFYFIDPTPRAGLPSSASQMELWKNLPEIIWAGAHGELVEPEPAAQFSCECVLTMKSDKGAWAVTEVPKELQRWMKLGSCCEIGGKACFPPEGEHHEEIGWMVSLGDTMREAVETMLAQVDLLPDGVSANTESLVELIKEVHNAESDGIEFADRVPNPAIVIED